MRKIWNFPPFSPERINAYEIRTVRVTHWTRLNRFILSINVTADLHNERIGGRELEKRLRLGFEASASPFSVLEAVVDHSTVAFCFKAEPGFTARFMAQDLLLLQSVKKPDVKLRIASYATGSIEPPKPGQVDDDIPF